jgi:DNA-binding NtrC family response regulator
MARRPRILIVDDEPNMCRSLQIALGEEGRYEVVTTVSAREGLEMLRGRVDLLLADLTMPELDGLTLLRKAKELTPETQVILMTAYSTVESAVEAMKAGAFEYLIKPFSNDEVQLVVQSALRLRRLERENRELRARLREHALGGLIGDSEPMQRVRRLVERAAESDATVLVTGESGTGKELIAHAVHDAGERKDGPFVAVNCAALAESLLESELFGHEKGAFTGAVRKRAGTLEQADGGTLFLDEVGDMSPALQTKLLRVLETRSFQRVGGNETISVDVRFIAATNRDLTRLVADGAFREDLYYRLNVVAIEAPPVRQRREDIPQLIDHILQSLVAARGAGRPVRAISDEARAALFAYDFPGNVRELENLLERALVLAEGPEIGVADLPMPGPAVPRPRPSIDGLLAPGLENGWAELQAHVKELERQLLDRATDLWRDRSNEEIARLLGTSRRVLELRLQEHGLRKK